MNDTLKWILIGIGAYLLYETYVANPALGVSNASNTSTVPPPAPGTGTSAASANQTTSSAPTAAQQSAINALTAIQQASVQSAIQSAAGNPPTQTASQWNWYFNMVTQFPAPADLGNYIGGTAATDPTVQVTFAQWLAAALAYYQVASNSPTGLGATKRKDVPLTYDMEAVSWN